MQTMHTGMPVVNEAEELKWAHLIPREININIKTGGLLVSNLRLCTPSLRLSS